MTLSGNHVHFFISYAVAFLAFGLIGKWFLYPSLRRRPLEDALVPLLLFACLRVNGLTFLMPGVVSADLPMAFARPTAYGDLIAVLLALTALWALRHGWEAARTLVWVFNVWGLLDLVYANVATFLFQVDPAQLGAAYFLVVLNVPAMTVVHVIIFILLLRAPSAAEPRSVH